MIWAWIVVSLILTAAFVVAMRPDAAERQHKDRVRRAEKALERQYEERMIALSGIDDEEPDFIG